MKKVLISFFVLICLVLLSACGNIKQEVIADKTKAVKVITVSETEQPATKKYVGSVVSDKVKVLSFKTPGKIEKINVKNGDWIKKGQELASLDTQDLIYSVNAAEAGMLAAKTQFENSKVSIESSLKKVEDAYAFANNNYQKLKELYEAGAISKSTLDEGKLELDIRSSELNEAREIADTQNAGYHVYKQAEANYYSANQLLEEASLISDMDGYVLDIMLEEGEMVSAGMPVIAIGSNTKSISFGLSESDLDEVNISDKAVIKADDIEITEAITGISKSPDIQTRTYETEILVNSNDNKLKLGQIVDISIHTASKKTILIPISSILSNGLNYVFVVEDGLAEKKNIEIIDITGELVRVKGLNPGDILIVEGLSKLKQGDAIAILD